MIKKLAISFLVFSIVIIASFFIFVYLPSKYPAFTYTNTNPEEIIDIKDIITHIPTPEKVKGIYITANVAGIPRLFDKLIKIVDETELNTVVIDVKDSTGMLSFHMDNPLVRKVNSDNKAQISDVVSLIKELHSKKIYVIARVASFQDSYYPLKYPNMAVQRKSTGTVWSDRKDVRWMDPGSKEYWNYLVAIAKESYEKGFDEINFDYIRFPTDGNMGDIVYPISAGKVKKDVIKEYYSYLRTNLGTTTISADLFGMTTSNKDDLGIGQILEDALKYFDYVCPMVYPSHYPKNFNNWAEPNSKPYDVIKFTMEKGIEKANNASSSPSKLRPWLQDFTLGKPVYGADEVKAQIKATDDLGLDGWLLWNASNVYTRGALLDK